ncbi:MAG: DciA family protein [Pseudomonadota bacterium]
MKPLSTILVEPEHGPLERAQRLARAERALHAVLPEALRPHCRLANIRDGQARLLVDASAWAVRLRYLETPIREALGVSGVTIRVDASAAPEDTPASPATRQRELPPGACQSLEQLAEDAEPGLASALRRLARHRRRED